MRRWKYLLRCQRLSTKNADTKAADTQRVAQQQLQIFVVSRAQRKLSEARRQLPGKSCFRDRNDETAADCDEEGLGLSIFQILEPLALFSELCVDRLVRAGGRYKFKGEVNCAQLSRRYTNHAIVRLACVGLVFSDGGGYFSGVG
jgi:hypothetical protein